MRGRGLFWALEFVADRATKQVFDPKLKLNERVKREALARGLAIYPMGGTIDGRQGDHVIVAPPYIATAADIDTIVDRLGAAVDAALPVRSKPAVAKHSHRSAGHLTRSGRPPNCAACAISPT